MENTTQNGSNVNKIDPAKISEFCGALITFKKILSSSTETIRNHVDNAGIDSATVTAELDRIRSLLDDLSSAWEDVQTEFENKMNTNLEDFAELQRKIQNAVTMSA